MLTKRLIACFDVVDGMITKARQFEDNIKIAAADELARELYRQQIDEIIFYDILASAERRRMDIATVERVASEVFVPLTVGGGIRDLSDMHAVLDAGGEKVSVDSMAYRHPTILKEGAREFGRQCMVASMQVKRVGKRPGIPSGYEIAIDGARHFTGTDAVEWAQRVEELGAGEICVNSIDQDGTHAGFDLEITSEISRRVSVPVIASGGAGNVRHIAEAFDQGGASAAIISSMLYSPRMPSRMTVAEVKHELTKLFDVRVRPYREEGVAKARTDDRCGSD